MKAKPAEAPQAKQELRLIQIKHKFRDAVLYELRCGSLYACAEKAVEADASLSYADLAYADLTGADLAYADLAHANLTGATLSYSSLTGADLSHSSLTGADLTGVDLTDVDLTDANLAGSNLTGASGIIPLGYPNGWFSFAYLAGPRLVFRIGCRTKGLYEARSYWAGKDNRREVLAALDYAVVIARLRGWKFVGSEGYSE